MKKTTLRQEQEVALIKLVIQTLHKTDIGSGDFIAALPHSTVTITSGWDGYAYDDNGDYGVTLSKMRDFTVEHLGQKLEFVEFEDTNLNTGEVRYETAYRS